MKDYTIAQTADESVYVAQVRKIKAERPGYNNTERLQDVDCSDIFIFTYDDGTITVYYDTDVDAVYVKSDMHIEELLVNKPFHVKSVIIEPRK